MGAQLQAAFGKLTGVLKKQTVGEPGSEEGSQRGGTCGLHSLWYASIMLRTINPTAPEIWPRRRNNLAGAPGESLRHYAKHSSVVRSGQGEILNLGEMVMCIRHFQYKYAFNAFDERGRGAFITQQLAAEHPVLLPYLEGGPPPSCYPVRDKNDKDSGAHWALIYDETGSQYVFIDPHKPNTPQRFDKNLVLDANDLVDAPEFRFQPVYNKEGFDAWGYKGSKTYNLGDVDKRSRLQALLISVYY